MDPNEIAVVTYHHAREVDSLDPVVAMAKAREAAGDVGHATRIEDLVGEVAELKQRLIAVREACAS